MPIAGKHQPRGGRGVGGGPRLGALGASARVFFFFLSICADRHTLEIARGNSYLREPAGFYCKRAGLLHPPETAQTAPAGAANEEPPAATAPGLAGRQAGAGDRPPRPEGFSPLGRLIPAVRSPMGPLPPTPSRARLQQPPCAKYRSWGSGLAPKSG